MKRGLQVALGLSLFLHALLAGYLFQSPTTGSAPRQPLSNKKLSVRTLTQNDFEKELRTALDSKEAQIVQSDPRLKSELAPLMKDKIRLSATHQKVDQETRSARFGKFKNVLNEGQDTKNTEISKLFELADDPERDAKVAALNKKSNTGRLHTFKNRAPASAPSTAGEGLSATDDYLPDVAIGVNTLLNAKEYKFYSFYARVRQQLTEVWQLKLRHEFQRISNKGQNIVGDHLTQVQVKLNANGSLKTVKIIGSSGVREFDLAAAEAFHQAAPFPNPPQGMISKDDNLVSLRWDFIVVASEDSGLRVKMGQGGSL